MLRVNESCGAVAPLGRRTEPGVAVVGSRGPLDLIVQGPDDLP
jgi:hypothetical protein